MKWFFHYKKLLNVYNFSKWQRGDLSVLQPVRTSSVGSNFNGFAVKLHFHLLNPMSRFWKFVRFLLLTHVRPLGLHPNVYLVHDLLLLLYIKVIMKQPHWRHLGNICNRTGGAICAFCCDIAISCPCFGLFMKILMILKLCNFSLASLKAFTCQVI